SVEENPTGGRRQCTGTHVQERGLARSVGSGDAENFALLDIEGKVVQSRKRAEFFAQFLDREDCLPSWARPGAGRERFHRGPSKFLMPHLSAVRMMANYVYAGNGDCRHHCCLPEPSLSSRMRQGSAPAKCQIERNGHDFTKDDRVSPPVGDCSV